MDIGEASKTIHLNLINGHKVRGGEIGEKRNEEKPRKYSERKV